jgi:hypothetical protein
MAIELFSRIQKRYRRKDTFVLMTSPAETKNPPCSGMTKRELLPMSPTDVLGTE